MEDWAGLRSGSRCNRARRSTGISPPRRSAPATQASPPETIEKAGIDLDKPVVTTCGSGITAAIITLALESLGHGNNRLYDGSWSEWGSRADTPIVTGKD